MLRKQGRYLIILDDVWSKFLLKEVGIPEQTVDNGCKLVLTTRSKEIVRSMDCKKVEVTCLSMDESLQLFLRRVGQDVLPNPTLESVVAECDGLPLAIVTIAGCMRGISDLLVWENALNELGGYIRIIRDMEDTVFGCLNFGYDRLKKVDRDCFLYCALYPEDHEIRKEMNLENWMCEGLIEEMGSRKAMQGSGHSIIQKLEENYLLESVGAEGTHIKMHDVVRDMALHITRKRFLVKSGEQLIEVPSVEEWREDLEKVSLMHNYISTIPLNMKFPKFQKLTTLLLLDNRLNKIPESFFDHMPNLKILNLSFNGIAKLPNSISNLEKLTALSLHRCYYLDHLPSLLKLQALKKLDLGNTSIKEIPQGLEMLVNLRYVDLGLTSNLKKIPDGLLLKLCHLQNLAIHPASTRAEEIRKLNKLEVFEGCFPNVCDLIMFIGQRKRLHKYLIWVTHELNYQFFYGSRDYNNKVVFEGKDMNFEDEVILPSDIQQLELYGCKGMTSLNDICGWEHVTDLKNCTIWKCKEVQSIFLSRCCPLKTLESLNLEYIPNLKGMVEDSSQTTFSSLKEICMYKCGKIKKLFSATWDLRNLEVINVMRCQEMEEIIVPEKEGIMKFKYSLPKLWKLFLVDLPELKSIYSENGVMVCDSLQHMEIINCTKLKRTPLHLPVQEPASLPPFKEICMGPKQWWESVELDHPHAKNVLVPLLKFSD
ncbi:hypothetical protein PTKIN_Ptkin16aG0529200 [Pterospermum kingtungense]